MATRKRVIRRSTNPIGRDRFITELTPLTGAKGLSPGSGVEDLNQDFLTKHKNDIDGFLISSGYFGEIHFSPDDPSYVYVPGDDDADDIVPDLSLFNSHLLDLLYTDQDDFDEQAGIITTMMYRDLYDSEDIEIVGTAKAVYLCSLLSRVFNIEHIETGRAGGIIINGMLTDLRILNMTADLGFPSASYPTSFIMYLHEYINDERYLKDGFNFGQAVLSAYDRHVEPIGWF